MPDQNPSGQLPYPASAVIPDPDTTDIQLPDTTRVLSPDSAGIQLPDSIPAPSPDSAGIELPDTLQVPPPDSAGIELPDTLQVPPSDSAGVELPDALQLPSPGSSDVKLPYKILTSEPVILPVPADVVRKPKLYTYDASWYLNRDEPGIFTKDQLFPFYPGNKASDSVSKIVFVDYNPAVVKKSASEYSEYLKNDIHITQKAEAGFSGAWIPGLVILSLLLLTWIKIFYIQFLSPVLVSAFNYKAASKLFNERNASAQNAFLVLQLIFAINSGLFLYFIVGHFNLKMPGIDDFAIFLSLSAVLIVLFAIRFFALKLLGFLFDKRRIFSEYRHNLLLYNKVYGILLLPLIAGLLYLGDGFFNLIIYSGLILGAIIYLLQLVRGIEIIIKEEFSVFYLILYLCAFEILPVLFLYKLFQVVLV